MAAEVEEEAALVVLRGDRPHLLVDRSRSSRSIFEGMCFSSAISSAIRSGSHRPAQLGEPQPEQVHRRDLADEGLGRGDADLEAGAGEQDGVGVAGRLAAHDVGDREHLRAALAGEAHRGERVGGLARLGDADHQVVLAQRPGRGSGTRRRCPSRPGRAPTARSRSGRPGRRGRRCRRRRSRSGRSLRRKSSSSSTSERSTPSRLGRRSVIVSATASGCSWISFIMKVA